MASKTFPFLFTLLFLLLLLLLKPRHSAAQTTVVKAAYWFPSGFAVSAINSSLFTHLFCAFADVNPTTYQATISSSNAPQFSTFTQTVQQKNPSVKTLLSIGGGDANASVFSAMASQASRRKSFVDSSIGLARSYSFHGLDLDWHSPSTPTEMTNFGTLLTEWRAAVAAESQSTGRTALLLTAAVFRSSNYYSILLPVQKMSSSLDWINVMTYDFYGPGWSPNSTGPPAALYDTTASQVSGDTGISAWIQSGMPAKKIALGLPFYGRAWRLVNPNNNGLFAPANGSAISASGVTYSGIRSFVSQNSARCVYNSAVVTDYCYSGTTWIGYDDVNSVSTKVSYAKEKGLLGYFAWHAGADSNWILSQTAHGINGNQQSKRRIMTLISTISATIIMLLIAGLAIYYLRTRMLRSKDEELKTSSRRIKTSGDSSASNELNNLQVFGFTEIEEATNRFSFENKLGEGGFGPVYKGTLRNGMAIAVKKLSKSSKQGFEEFKNEVSLTAKLQHVNLVRVLGFCIQRDEQMLIYEYMPNKSLDFFIFDHSKRLLLDWETRVKIIEGVTQGLLYLQEYSRLTIIHRDLKASNILLDDKMNAKISDFGMAKIFAKDKHEENTDRIVGTYGYAPPEYLREGVYSTKSDVYSFGVLLLQIISGKKNVYQYGPNEDMHLLDYGYELWKEGKEMEFVDSSLDDRFSTCKLNRCLQIGLLCVQENASDRPSMPDISSMLKNEIITIAPPKKPAFSKKKGQENQQNYIPGQQPDRFSVNTITLSVLDGR